MYDSAIGKVWNTNVTPQFQSDLNAPQGGFSFGQWFLPSIDKFVIDSLLPDQVIAYSTLVDDIFSVIPSHPTTKFLTSICVGQRLTDAHCLHHICFVFSIITRSTHKCMKKRCSRFGQHGYEIIRLCEIQKGAPNLISDSHYRTDGIPNTSLRSVALDPLPHFC